MTVEPPLDRWRDALADWALPAELLATVDESPYAWPAKAYAASTRPDPVTGPLLRRLLPRSGSVLDVGAGTGRLSLPLAGSGHRVTAVEPNAAMATELERLAAGSAAPVTIVRSRWPEAAATVGDHDVVLSANVVYDIAEVGPFLEALHATARMAVVLELTRRHPWDGLRGYYRALHGLDLPDGPRAGDLIAVIASVLGVAPERQEWSAPPALRFRSREDLLDLYAIRLCVPLDRRGELERLLAPDIDGGDVVVLGTAAAGMTTLWWSTA